MIVSKIKALPSNKYELIIDEKKHIILGDVLLECNLLKPREITKEEYNKIITRNSFYENYRKIIRYIAFKMRTEKEIKTKLSSLHVPSVVQNNIIDKIKEEGYLNNKQYLKSYIADQLNLTLNGPIKIINNLKKLGFAEKEIIPFIEDINNNIWIERINRIIQKKEKANHKLSIKKFKMKLEQDLYSLGYKSDMIKPLIEEIDFDDSSQLNSDYQKLYRKYSKKYNSDKLNSFIKQKLYMLGYSIDEIENAVKSVNF